MIWLMQRDHPEPSDLPGPKRILIFACAAREGGAWAIANYFAELSRSERNIECSFVTVLPLEVDGVNNLTVHLNSFRERLGFELFGVRKLLRDIRPDAILSLNNLPILGAIGYRQFVYLHTALPFYPERRWRLTARERKFFFYRFIYSFLIRWSVRLMRARLIVQTATMVHRVRTMWGIESLCWFPQVTSVDSRQELTAPRRGETIDFVYPALYQPHKNHAVLVEAMSILKREQTDIYPSIRVLFTIDPIPDVSKRSDGGIVFVGQLPREEVFSIYDNVAAVVFPSMIETVGLPLVEASSRGLPILCADRDFAREIVGDYSGATFLPGEDAKSWADAIAEMVRQVSGSHRLNRFEKHTVAVRSTTLGDIAT